MLISIFKDKVFLLLISMFFSVVSYAQVNLIGTWTIDNLIGIRDLKEYSLVAEKELSFGNNLSLELDGTFSSEYLAECLKDCFASTSGRFIRIDDTHIRFILVNTHYRGWCGKDSKSESDLNKDLGIFYIYKDSGSVRLIESNGILQDDKDKMLYTEMLNTFDKNWKSYDYSWMSIKSKTPEEIVKDCIDNRNGVDLSNCTLLFSKKEDYGKLFLLRHKENFHYVLYDDYNQKVSLAYPRRIE